MPYKRTPWYICFRVSFAKFSRISSFMEYLRWLLLRSVFSVDPDTFFKCFMIKSMRSYVLNIQKISALDCSQHVPKFLSSFRLVFKNRVHINFYGNTFSMSLFCSVYLFQKAHLRHKFSSASFDKQLSQDNQKVLIPRLWYLKV